MGGNLRRESRHMPMFSTAGVIKSSFWRVFVITGFYCNVHSPRELNVLMTVMVILSDTSPFSMSVYMLLAPPPGEQPLANSPIDSDGVSPYRCPYPNANYTNKKMNHFFTKSRFINSRSVMIYRLKFGEIELLD